MSPLRLEAFNSYEDTWKLVGELQPGDAYASISDTTADGRDVYIFGVNAIEDKGEIKKSRFGIDIESGTERKIHDLAGLMAVAALSDGERFEMTVHTDKSPEPRKLRFTYTS
jgi:hypothetical protein